MLWYNECENLCKESDYNFSYNTGTQYQKLMTFPWVKVAVAVNFVLKTLKCFWVIQGKHVDFQTL